MPITFPALLKKKGVLIATGTAVLIAVGGGTTAAVAATGDSTPTTTASASADGFYKDMPATLKADLKTLRSLPKGSTARKTEWKTIVADAHAGDFGQRYYYIGRLLHREHRVRALFGERYAKLPQNLKTDIATLRALPVGSAARKAERQKIEQNALAGDYGNAIKVRAEKIEQRIEHRRAAASATPSASPSTSS